MHEYRDKLVFDIVVILPQNIQLMLENRDLILEHLDIFSAAIFLSLERVKEIRVDTERLIVLLHRKGFADMTKSVGDGQWLVMS